MDEAGSREPFCRGEETITKKGEIDSLRAGSIVLSASETGCFFSAASGLTTV